MIHGKLLALFLTVATLLRWSWNFARPLSEEESYLALCGFIPSLAYFDGPGGTPLLVALGISVAGAGGFGATFFWPILAALASVAAYFLVRALAGPRDALAVAVLLNLLPVVNHAALHATCAMPLTTASLGAVLFAWYALEKNSAAFWALAGIFSAFGLFFSYTAWFLVPTLGLALLASHRWRRRLLAPGFWMAWVAPLALYLMLLRWNAGHGWVHFIGGTWRTALSLDFSNLAPAFVSAAYAITPLVLALLIVAAVLATARLTVSPKIKFVALPALASFLAVLYAALRGLPTSSPGLLAASLALPLLAWLPAQLGRIPANVATTIVFLTASLWSALNLERPDSRVLIDADLGRKVEDVRAAQTDPAQPPIFLVAQDAPLAAALALALPAATAEPGHPPVYTLESAAARSQFDLWPRYDQFVEASAAISPETALDPFTEQDGVNPFIGRSALYITRQPPDDLPQAITAAFSRVQLLEEIPAADGVILRVYLCSDYQTMPL